MHYPKIMDKAESNLIMLIDWENISYGRNQYVHLERIIQKANTWGNLRHSIAFSGFNEKYAGLIGYFPTYTIGALMSAQFSNKLRKDITNLDDEIENGDFKSLINWLKINIHEKASFFSTNEVLEQVTKSPLNAKYFKEYITNRYL